MWVSVDEMTHLTHENRITLGQCFNLAHAEMLKDQVKDTNGNYLDSFLIDRTIELFELKQKIDNTIKKVDFPI